MTNATKNDDSELMVKEQSVIILGDSDCESDGEENESPMRSVGNKRVREDLDVEDTGAKRKMLVAAEVPASMQKDVVIALMDLSDAAHNFDNEADGGPYNHHGGEFGRYHMEAKKELGYEFPNREWSALSAAGFEKICAAFPREVEFLRKHNALQYKTPSYDNDEDEDDDEDDDDDEDEDEDEDEKRNAFWRTRP